MQNSLVFKSYSKNQACLPNNLNVFFISTFRVKYHIFENEQNFRNVNTKWDNI